MRGDSWMCPWSVSGGWRRSMNARNARLPTCSRRPGTRHALAIERQERGLAHGPVVVPEEPEDLAAWVRLPEPPHERREPRLDEPRLLDQRVADRLLRQQVAAEHDRVAAAARRELEEAL